MLEDMFLFTDIYIRYKDITIFVVCSDDAEIISLETDGSKESWYFDVNKEKFSSLVAKLLNKDIGNNRKKDSKYFQLYSKSNLIKVFTILNYNSFLNGKFLKFKKVNDVHYMF